MMQGVIKSGTQFSNVTYLPSNAPIDFSVFGHAGRHMTIGNEQFGHEIGAGIKSTSDTEKMVRWITCRLKGLAGIQAHDAGLIAIEFDDCRP
jgi:hypothetical protein